jgi:serine/threonine-protein kinase
VSETPSPSRPGWNGASQSEESRLPLPGDSASAASAVPGAGGKRQSGDTAEIVTGKPTKAEEKSGGSSGGSMIDSIVGRLVVEQGLATRDEVDAIRKRKADEANQRSFAQALVEERLVTERQLARLRSMVEQERSGSTIPGYKVLEKLGAGAMATVFKAKQLSLDRMVAIKILPRKFSSNPQFIERFYAEGRAAAQLNHPNIVQAFDVGQAGEFHYFVMEYVEGQTVHDLIVANKRFNEQEALDIAISVAEALDHAHQKGLIHRDVKPKNIMFTPQGVVKVADLGLARAIGDKEAAEAEAGKAYGTPYYISPEQIRGEVNIGPQADIYSLGSTVYHMITGSVPFNGKNPGEVMQKHLKAPLIPPDHANPKLSAGISEVVERMMAKSRKDRYKNCQELLIDLRAVRRREPPPIAHKEAPASAVLEALKTSAALPASIPEDRSQPVRTRTNPMMIYIAIGALCYSFITTIIVLMMMLSR